MGITYVNGHVTGQSGEPMALRFLVDSGSSFSLIPFGVWQTLGIEPCDKVECVLIDGSVIERKVGDCKLAVAGKNGLTRVVLGEPSDTEPLLGALTLEQLGMVLEPFSRTLRPMRFRL